MATMAPGQYTLLVNRIAQQHQIEQRQLLTLTTPQLMALARSLNSERDDKTWARGIRQGFEAITKQQQVGSAALATALYARSAEVYKASGMAPRNFAPKTPDTAKFLLKPAKTIYGSSHRELNYFTSLVEKDRFPRQKVIDQMQKIAQTTLMRTSRELVLETAEEDDFTNDSDWGDVEERFESDEQYYRRHGLDFDDDSAFDSLDLDDMDDLDLDDPEVLAAQADEEYERMMDEFEEADEAEELEMERESAMKSYVKPGGCEFCKLAANFPSFGQVALHKGCSCVGQPSWKAEELEQPEWAKEMDQKAQEARKRISADNKKRKALGMEERSYSSTEHMREMRRIDHEKKNATLEAAGETPKKYQGQHTTATTKKRVAYEKKMEEKADARAERKAKEKEAWANVPKEQKKAITVQRKKDLEELRASQARIDERDDLPGTQKERMKAGMKTLYNKRDKERRSAAMGIE